MGKLAKCQGVEIFRAGNWKGRPYTHRDLDRIVENFKKHSTGERPAIRPQAVIGHEHDQSLLKNTGHFSVGEIKNVWRDGDYLKADIANIPPFMARLINGRAYNGVSAEIYQRPPEGIEGADGEMLRRIAFMGGDIPHVKSLAELPACDYEEFSEELLPPSVLLNRAPSIIERDGVLIFFSEVIHMNRDAVMEKLMAMSDEEFQQIADMVMGSDSVPQDTDGDNEAGETGDVYEDDQGGTPEVPEEQPEMPPEESDDDEEVASYSEKPIPSFPKQILNQMKRVESNLVKMENESKKSLVQSFCESMLKEGRISSVHLDETNPKSRSLFQSLMAADNKTVVQTFSENGKEVPMTEFDLRMEEIRNWPVIAKFSEKVKTGKTVNADEKKNILKTFAEQHPEVVAVTTKNETDFVDFFSKNFDEFKNTVAKSTGFPVNQ